ncbi:hypothetical protein NAS2_1419 [Conexivisphaera calida]|uniref:Uncharacterized protein n=1 Tax=Conexivisphaera calida TaxID=1874277 RepID=A0A4P2VDV1_9ARCH|nr:hypothetical protein NAS2_1419 [Conexivisphaera calida]
MLHSDLNGAPDIPTRSGGSRRGDHGASSSSSIEKETTTGKAGFSGGW